MTPLKPLSDRLICEKIDLQDQKTALGIYLPDTGKTDKIVRAKVLRVGPDVKAINEGDTVIFGPYQYVEVTMPDGKKYFIGRELDIDAILETK